VYQGFVLMLRPFIVTNWTIYISHNPHSSLPHICTSTHACIHSALTQNKVSSPNGMPELEGMLVRLAQVLATVITNPYRSLTSWATPEFEDVATLCANSFGPTRIHPATKAEYNVVVSGRRYLLPQLWDPVKQSCVV
jgi:hypothetical protein